MSVIEVGDGKTFTTIQSAIDAALAGDTISIATGTYAESLVVDKGVTLVGVGDVIIDPASGAAITVSGGLDGADVTLDNLNITGGTNGIFVTADADARKLTVINSTISGNTQHGIYVIGDDPDDDGLAPIIAGITAIEVIDTDFSANGTQTNYQGSASIKLFGFAGDALFRNVTIAGAEDSAQVADRPDNAIEIVGYVDGGNANPVGSDAPDIGTVVFDGVTVSGAFHKNPIGIFNFSGIEGLSIGGDNGGIDLTGAESSWGPLFNLDGIEDSAIDASGFDLAFPDNADVKTEIQGDKEGQDGTDQTITGTSDNDALMGKAGDDVLDGGDGDDILYGADKPGGDLEDETGNDTLNGGEGNDALYGGRGNDTLYGGTGDDVLWGDGNTGYATDFAEFNLGSWVGQQGWKGNGASGLSDGSVSAIDGEIIDQGGGNKAFRLSNAATTGNYDVTIPTTPKVLEAGEAASSVVDTFVFGFDFRSVSSTVQEGLAIDLTPIDVDGVAIRQGILSITDSAEDGLSLVFWQYVDGAFESVTLATNLDRDSDHHVEVTMLFRPGADNDKVEVTVDGVTYSALTSWEGYYANENLPTNGVDTIAFRVAGSPHPELQGLGIAFDNLVVDSYDSSGSNDTLDGGEGNDTLNGGNGNDILSGGPGVDTLDGGEGTDTADFSDATEAVVVALDGGNAAAVTIGGASRGTVANVENIVGGSGDDILTGDGKNNTFTGGAGSDTIDGGGGDDTVVYAAALAKIDLTATDSGWSIDDKLGGTDTVSNVKFIEHAGGRYLLVDPDNGGFANAQDAAAAATRPGDQIIFATPPTEPITIDLTDPEEGVTIDIEYDVDTTISIGGSSDNSVTTGGGNDHVTSGEGNDHIKTGDGNDYANAGGGNDELVGGSGNGDDVYDGGTGENTIIYTSATHAIAVDLNEEDRSDTPVSGADGPDGAPDTIGELLDAALGNGNADTPVGIASGEDIGTDALINIANVVAGAGDDTLTGNAEDNIFTGAGGSDTLAGGEGIDTAVYEAAITAAMFGDDGEGHFTVSTGGEEGTDTLSGIEVVDHGGDGNILLVGNGGYASIQEAIDAAEAGDTIVIAAGTYKESVSIDKDGLTLVGLGEVVIKGPLSKGTSDTLLEQLKTDGSYGGGGSVGIKVDADNVTISNLTVTYNDWGIELADGADGTTLTDLTLQTNVYGIYKQGTAAIDGLTISGGSISDGYNGINFDKAVGGGDAVNVTIDGTHFQDLLRKGVYVETLSDSHLTNITMENVGQFGGSQINGPLGAGGNGINLNLKYGDYANIEIDNFTLNNVGASNQDGNADSSANGGAIVIEARDDSGYGGDPATATNITIHDGTISGTTSTGVHVGEPGKDNAGPAVAVDNITISATTEHSADHGDIANESASTMTVVGTASGDSLVASGDSDGAFDINGAGGDDTIAGGSGNDMLAGGAGDDSISGRKGADSLNGGSGTDTAVFSGVIAASDISFDGSNWKVDGGPDGTDILEDIEQVSHSGTGMFLLVGGSGFANRSAAEAVKGSNDLLLFASTPGPISDSDGAANTVVERVAAGTVVGIDASATDGLAGPITYTLTDSAGGRFAIDAASGVVTVADGNLLDVDVATSQQITVRATNSIGAFTEASFIIAVTEAPAIDEEGTNKKDDLVGSTGDDFISGRKGNDRIEGKAGDDTLLGQKGRDKLKGGDGDDTLKGGKGKDKVKGNDGDDLLSGGKGKDVIHGGSGVDTLTYESSNGKVKINLGKAKQKGGDAEGDKLKSIENVTGSDGNDTLVGDGGANVLDGGKGRDKLLGKGGADTLIGGEGNDKFYFKTGYGQDTIADFGSGDRIVLSMKGIDGFADAKALMDEVDGDVVVDFGKSDVLTILDTTIAALAKHDFHI